MRWTAAALALLLIAALALLPRTPPPAEDPGVSVAAALGGEENEGWRRAFEPRDFVFPTDHGPHPEYRTEWWYLTGNLETAEGRHFGFQITFFRIGLSPWRYASDSIWRSNQLYMGHLALTDSGARRFHAFERFARGTAGLAGAEAAPVRVWLEDWSLHAEHPSGFPLRLRAAEDGVALDLRLEQIRPPVLQGDRGLSRKSAEPGNASYYYSLTRLPAAGTVTADGRSHEVTGLAWLDREWSTSALGPDQEGWDWFALQLADGRDLMFYQLRRRDGSADPLSKGSLVDAGGLARPLGAEEVEIQVLDHWRSPRGTRYPGRWRLRVPAEDLDLLIEPVLADQELALSVRYWEGAVRVSGSAAGRGYVELAGYAD